MPIHINDNSVCGSNITIPLIQFPAFHAAHMRHVANTCVIEGIADALVVADFPSALITHFVRQVCRWGNFAGVGGRVLRNNTIDSISEHIQKACVILRNDQTDSCKCALREINQISRLGRPSFASKHLRFLNPQKCPVLDNLIHRAFGYPMNPEGYQQYADDCAKIITLLKRKKIKLPIKRPWFVADVDMALFAAIQKWPRGS